MRKDDCIFCKIAAGEIPSQTVYEDEYFRAILDLAPATEGHTLILPKEHFADLTELGEEYSARVLAVAAKLGKAMKEGLSCSGFNVVQNNGSVAGQTVMHFHMHIIPRYDGEDRMILWAPGTSTPEGLKKTAEKIRGPLNR